jgi:hypothetical protein
MTNPVLEALDRLVRATYKTPDGLTVTGAEFLALQLFRNAARGNERAIALVTKYIGDGRMKATVEIVRERIVEREITRVELDGDALLGGGLQSIAEQARAAASLPDLTGEQARARARFREDTAPAALQADARPADSIQ